MWPHHPPQDETEARFRFTLRGEGMASPRLFILYQRRLIPPLFPENRVILLEDNELLIPNCFSPQVWFPPFSRIPSSIFPRRNDTKENAGSFPEQRLVIKPPLATFSYEHSGRFWKPNQVEEALKVVLYGRFRESLYTNSNSTKFASRLRNVGCSFHFTKI